MALTKAQQYRLDRIAAYKQQGEIVKNRLHYNIHSVCETLRDYQVDIISRMHDDLKGSVGADSAAPPVPPAFRQINTPLGSGKTRIAAGIIKAISDRIREQNQGRILLVVPDAIVESWAQELDLWGVAYLRNSDFENAEKVASKTPGEYPYPNAILTQVRDFYWSEDFTRDDKVISGYVYNPADVILVKTSDLEAFMKAQLSDKEAFQKVLSLLVWDEFDTANVKLEDTIAKFKNVIGISATYKTDSASIGTHAYTAYSAENVDVKPLTELFKHEILYRISERINDTLRNTRFQNLFSEGNYAESLVELGIPSVRTISDLINLITHELREEIKSNPELKETNEHKIAEIERRLKENMETCQICTDDIKVDSSLESQAIVCSRCQICFHSKCIMEWYYVGTGHPTCPFCKQDLINEGMVTINPSIGAPEAPTETAEADESAPPPPTIFPNKTASIIEALKRIKTEFYDQGVRPRLLIVNQSSENTDLKLITDSMPSLVIGNLYQDPKVVDRYREGEVDVINLNSWQDCAGLHIPETTHIVITAQVTPSAYAQIVGRGHRFGSTQDTHVYSCVRAT